MDNKVRKLIIVVLLGALFIVSAGFYLYANQQETNVVTIENRFIDINGDGLADYIQEAQVIINNGETNFTPNQSQ
jgi:hypothetical protein